MCITCWDIYGSPELTGEKIDKLYTLIVDVYRDSPTGGILHIVLDDWNLDDRDIVWCLKDAHRAPTEAEKACGRALFATTLKERASALARFDGYTKDTT